MCFHQREIFLTYHDLLLINRYTFNIVKTFLFTIAKIIYSRNFNSTLSIYSRNFNSTPFKQIHFSGFPDTVTVLRLNRSVSPALVTLVLLLLILTHINCTNKWILLQEFYTCTYLINLWSYPSSPLFPSSLFSWPISQTQRVHLLLLDIFGFYSFMCFQMWEGMWSCLPVTPC